MNFDFGQEAREALNDISRRLDEDDQQVLFYRITELARRAYIAGLGAALEKCQYNSDRNRIHALIAEVGR